MKKKLLIALLNIKLISNIHSVIPHNIKQSNTNDIKIVLTKKTMNEKLLHDKEQFNIQHPRTSISSESFFYNDTKICNEKACTYTFTNQRYENIKNKSTNGSDNESLVSFVFFEKNFSIDDIPNLKLPKSTIDFLNEKNITDKKFTKS